MKLYLVIFNKVTIVVFDKKKDAIDYIKNSEYILRIKEVNMGERVHWYT